MNKTFLILRDIDGKVLFEKKLTSLPLTEQAILSRSIEYFNDPEPCMIHRSAVMKRAYSDLFDFLCGREEILWRELPESLQNMVNIERIESVTVIKK